MNMEININSALKFVPVDSDETGVIEGSTGVYTDDQGIKHYTGASRVNGQLSDDGTLTMKIKEFASIFGMSDKTEFSIDYIDETTGETVSIKQSPEDLIQFNIKDLIYLNIENGIEPAEQIKTVTLAQFKVDDVLINHSLAGKTLHGLSKIAYGEPVFHLEPRNPNSKSRESYDLTASQDACSNFFFDNNGCEADAIGIVNVIENLKSKPEAKDFIYQGRVWFTVNKITEEYLRTKKGTIRAKKNDTYTKLVDSALKMLSGAQITGYSPDGRLLNVVYVMDAVKLEKVEFNGNIYTNVWGFTFNKTIGDYAKELGQTHRYALPEGTENPQTLDDVWVRNYLIDALHEARGKLYTTNKNGDPVKNKQYKEWTVKRSWDDIWSIKSPLRELSSRQKNNLITTFNTTLKELAEQDQKGLLHEGRPLYIYAYSERNPSCGRGKGKFINLVINCSNIMHVCEVDLNATQKDLENKKNISN